MKKLLIKIGKNFMAVAFLVIIVASSVSSVIDFSRNVSDFTSGAKSSIASVAEQSKIRLLDIRAGAEAFRPIDKLRALYIYSYGLTQRIFGNRYIYDANSNFDTVRMNNDHLTTALPKLTDERLSEITGGIADFSDFLSKENIGFLYVQLPFKICPYDKELPVGVEDYSNENTDRVLSALRSYSINTFDIREQIERDGLDWYSLFFRTDHHWLPSTALWASRQLCAVLNAEYGFRINTSLLDDNRFSKTTYRNIFLGSLGKRVGRFYAGVDDFTLILPKYNTNMVYSYHDMYDGDLSGKKTVRKGTFENSCVDRSFLFDDLMVSGTYSTYSIGNYPETITINKEIANGKILLIRDSFSGTAAPFLSLAACRELYTLDLRYYDGSVAAYVQKLRPDIVIVMLNPSVFPSFNEYRFNFMSGV